MLYYDRIDVSGRIDVNKTSASKECDICHYSHIINCGLLGHFPFFLKQIKKKYQIYKINTLKKQNL